MEETNSSLRTSLKGRLRNTKLLKSQGLLPLFEAVVNSIHAIEEAKKEFRKSTITIQIVRSKQKIIKDKTADGKEAGIGESDITGFVITDNGIGFNEDNFKSFETLDSGYKEKKGCKGIGRLVWLKAFQRVHIDSLFRDTDGDICRRTFDFDSKNEISNHTKEKMSEKLSLGTSVTLEGFNPEYRDKSKKETLAIANQLLEHCLWYYIRKEEVPQIVIVDENNHCIIIDDLFGEYQHSISPPVTFNVKDKTFEIIHIKLAHRLARKHQVAYSASGRLVKEHTLNIPCLDGELCDDAKSFWYKGFVTSTFLDESVRPERTDFDIEENINSLLNQSDISQDDIKNAVNEQVKIYLHTYLEQNLANLKERISSFVEHDAPKYRPIFERIRYEELTISHNASKKEMDLALHKEYAKVEEELINEGHALLKPGNLDNVEDYQNRIQSYLQKAKDIKKSDLANYVAHRRVILDLLKLAIQIQDSGAYAREDLIHNLIIPMRKESSEIMPMDCNLWLLDERLAFHHFLASDKTLKSMPITGSLETKEPDICALNVYDKPLLFNNGDVMPLASINVIEIKRPMRNDASLRNENPLDQVYTYLDEIRKGEVKTLTGRPVHAPENIPGFCYIICDLTKNIISHCRNASLQITSDKMGFFGYNGNHKAYIEVISFDRLVNAAEQRNRAFFDKLGLPNT